VHTCVWLALASLVLTLASHFLGTVGSPYGSQTSPNQRLSQLGSTSLVSANSDTYSSSKRLVAARETEIIMRARASQRESVKGKMLSEQELFRKKKFITKQMKTDIAVAKTTRSPFLVDLLAENERIDEENVVRLTEQAKRMRIFESRKEEAKNQIILRALQEASDLDALRKEKRIIMEEERRLKALLDIEKTKAHRKADRMAAARAERQRKSNKAEYRRAGNKEMLDDHRRREDNLLKLKHEVKAKPDNTFSTYNF